MGKNPPIDTVQDEEIFTHTPEYTSYESETDSIPDGTIVGVLHWVHRRKCHWCGRGVPNTFETGPVFVESFIRCDDIVSCMDSCHNQGKHWPPHEHEYAVEVGDIQWVSILPQ